MAIKNEKEINEFNNLRNKTSIAAYGISAELDDENIQINNIVKRTIIETKKKIGERTNEKPINYFNEINFGNAFSELFSAEGKDKEKNGKSLDDFKQYMSDNPQMNVGALMLENSDRTILFSNYRIIHKHIPECAQALNIYKDNIMSPDDYTKLIFNVSYDKADDEEKELVETQLKGISEKYQLEDKSDSIIEESLLLGEAYYAVLPLENELMMLLKDKDITSLNESLRLMDASAVSLPVLSENISINKEELEAISECFFENSEKEIKESDAATLIANLVNENVSIGSAYEILSEAVEADLSFSGTDIDEKLYKKNSEKMKKKDSYPLGINGSAIRRLDPERVIELRIGDNCYGYYYAEEGTNNLPQASYIGTTSGRSFSGAMSLSQNSTISSTTNSTYSPASTAANQLNVGEQKLKLISDLFLNAISKKIDKNFIRKNKQFKDFIYQLLRQDFIIKKGLKLTYFKPDEVIKFECQPVYRDIIFFAKLYLAILTNNLLIKLGRSHDKRVFYVNSGVDANYEQAIQTVIQDVKTKDYKMENLNDFNTVLNLTPGRFDDYYMPTINGERPIEIETLAGMDVDMNNDFVEYLKNSMMSGMGVPRNLIDVTSEIDFARTVSALNSNFVRSVIKYQKKLTPSFTRMYQILYKNEYTFSNDGNADVNNIDINSIRVSFPSPGALAMTNMSEQIQAVDGNAEFISQQLIPTKSDGSSEDKRLELKTKIVKDMLPLIDWDKYEKMKDKLLIDIEEEKIENKANPETPQDPYGVGQMY